LQGIIDDLQNGATHNEAQIELLQEQIEALQDFVDELIEQIDELIESVDYDNTNLLALIETLQRQVEGLQEMVERLEKEVEFLTSTINMSDMVIENAYGEQWDMGRIRYAGLEVSIDIPQRVVSRGSPTNLVTFSIRMTTTNTTDETIKFLADYLSALRGVSIAHIKLQSNSNIRVSCRSIYAVLPSTVLFVIQSEESIKFTYEVISLLGYCLYTNTDMFLPSGIYDIYFRNGIVFRNAIKII